MAGADVIVHGWDAGRGGAVVDAVIADGGKIAEVIAFLASPKASYVTRAVFAADGGRTAI